MAVYTDKATGRLYIEFQYKGQRYKERLPKNTTKKTAENIEIKMRGDLLFESHGIPTRRTEITFEQFLSEYFGPYADAHYAETSFNKAVYICKAAKPFFKGKAMRAIKPADIERFKAWRTALPTIHKRIRKPATVLRELAILSKVFSLAVRNDLIDYNPCSRVEKPKFDNVQNRILNKADEAKFFAAFKSLWAEDICRVVLNTGLRQNDVLGLRKFDVDRETGLIRLVQGKTRRRVEIPMNDTVRAIINRRWKGSGALLFPSPRTGRQAAYVRKAIYGACIRAKIPIVTIRDLRRTFGTRLHEMGFDDSTVAQLLGHSDMRSIHRYKRGTEIKKQAVFSLELPNSPQFRPNEKPELIEIKKIG